MPLHFVSTLCGQQAKSHWGPGCHGDLSRRVLPPLHALAPSLVWCWILCQPPEGRSYSDKDNGRCIINTAQAAGESGMGLCLTSLYIAKLQLPGDFSELWFSLALKCVTPIEAPECRDLRPRPPMLGSHSGRGEYPKAVRHPSSAWGCADLEIVKLSPYGCNGQDWSSVPLVNTSCERLVSCLSGKSPLPVTLVLRPASLSA